MIYFTKHAEEKFDILARHAFRVTKNQVTESVEKPELLDTSRRSLIIAERTISRTRVLRVVYKRERGDTIIITFYPGKKKQYEKK